MGKVSSEGLKRIYGSDINGKPAIVANGIKSSSVEEMMMNQCYF